MSGNYLAQYAAADVKITEAVHGTWVLSITEKQFKFITNLAKNLPWTKRLDNECCYVIKMVQRCEDAYYLIDKVTRKQATATIDALLKLEKKINSEKPPSIPKQQSLGKTAWEKAKPINGSNNSQYDTTQATLKALPISKYALIGDDGVIRFYEIKQAKTTGNYYVNQLIGSPGTWNRLYQNFMLSHTIGMEIAKNPKAAALLFTSTFKICSCCGAPLSNGKSLEQAMGPVCAKKFQ